jgi:uncharacterized protein
MALFAVVYRYVDDPELLTEHRPEHRQYLGSLLGERGLVASGPMTDGHQASALLVFQASAPEEIETLLDRDPFWREGLITHREINEWNVVLGSVGRDS